MFKLFPKKHSLSATLLKKVLLIYFAMTLFVTAIHLYIEYSYQASSLKTELEKIEYVFKPGLARAFWDKNYEQIRVELDGMINLQSIKGAKATDKDGQIIYEALEEDSEEPAFSHTFDIQRELFGQKIRLGSVSVFSSKGVIIERIKVNFMVLFFNAMLKSVVLLFLFFWAFKKYLTTPLDGLMKGIGQIDLDNLKNEKLEYITDKPDEIHRLTTTINYMLERLESEIQNSKQKDAMLFQQSKMAALGEMIGNISHQWKQPLNAIAIYTDSIKEDFDDGVLNKERMEQHRREVWQQIRYMDTTMREFKEFYNPDRQKQLFSPNQTIQKSLEILKSLITKSDVNIITDLKNQKECYGYQNELAQVLINIIKNATDEMSPNAADKTILISSLSRGDKIIISVQDSAGGVPQNIINTIFERNFTTKQERGGSGLGLYMSKSIIEEHFMGKLSVTNEHFVVDGRELYGARFTILIQAV